MNHAFRELLAFLYGEERAEVLVPRLLEILRAKGAFASGVPDSAAAAPGGGDSPPVKTSPLPFTNRDAFLISYGDMLSPPKAAETAADRAARTGTAGPGKAGGTAAAPEPSALVLLRRFLEGRNKGAFSYLHILPFHPYSSDDGFSVIDYRKVDPRLGSWEDLEALKELPALDGKLRLAFDFVVNHGSVHSPWFRGFLADDETYRSWYITRPGDYDWSSVVRPRTHPLLTPFTVTGRREPVYVWTTFSADQADYDFSNPEVLLEFIRILLEYAGRGAGIVRLDAVAYLWKEDGTSCLHHPKTHAVVKLFRHIAAYLGLPLLILTETNVPHEDNVSYFGKAVGDPRIDALPEAHMVYNFALPPLTLHAALSGDAGPLRRWARTLPDPGAERGEKTESGRYFLNFLASHDGVGLTPARGLVDEDAFNATIEEARRRGALVSYKSSPGGDVPYELNCSLASVVAPETLPGGERFGDPALRARAFLAVHGVLFSLPGLPAVYFHSWIGSEAWKEGPALLGYNRAINREKPSVDRVEEELDDPRGFRFYVYRGIGELLAFRQKEPAFNPDVPQYVLETGGGSENRGLFVLLRGPSADGGWVLCLENLCGKKAVWKKPAPGPRSGLPGGVSWPFPAARETIALEPWETLWLGTDAGGTENRRLSTAE
ncbi:MAG: sugar phosphorylase [Treponema sp.]|jgi:sucrose phosphorylase|nr:sugar phosphorylase [Treponema sp.]